MVVWYVLVAYDVTTDSEVFLYPTEELATLSFKDRVAAELASAREKGFSIADAKKDCLIQTWETDERKTAFFSRVVSSTGAETFIKLGHQGK